MDSPEAQQPTNPAEKLEDLERDGTQLKDMANINNVKLIVQKKTNIDMAIVIVNDSGIVVGSSDGDPEIETAIGKKECDILVTEGIKRNKLEISQTNSIKVKKQQIILPLSKPPIQQSDAKKSTEALSEVDVKFRKQYKENNRIIESNSSVSINANNDEEANYLINETSITNQSETILSTSPKTQKVICNVECKSIGITSSTSALLSLPSTSIDQKRTISSCSSSNKELSSVVDIINDDSLPPRRHPSEIDENSLLDKVILYSLTNNLFSNKSLESRVKDASMLNCFNTSTVLCSSPTKTCNIKTNAASSSSASCNSNSGESSEFNMSSFSRSFSQKNEYKIAKNPIITTAESKILDLNKVMNNTKNSDQKTVSQSNIQNLSMLETRNVQENDETVKIISSNCSINSLSTNIKNCGSIESQTVDSVQNQVQKSEIYHLKHKNKTIATRSIIEQYDVSNNNNAVIYRKLNEFLTSNEIKIQNCDDLVIDKLIDDNKCGHSNTIYGKKCNKKWKNQPSTSSTSTTSQRSENIDCNNQSIVVSGSNRPNALEEYYQISEKQSTSFQSTKHLDSAKPASINDQTPATLDLTIPNRNSLNEEFLPPYRNSALYVRNPDFSRKIFAAPGITSDISTTVRNDLSQLHMKTPDFSKVSRLTYTTELQIQNPDFTNKFPQLLDNRPSSSMVHVDANNFAKIRQINNYISDLQLKNPGPIIANVGVNLAHSSTAVQNPTDKEDKRIIFDTLKEKIVLEEPTAHVIHKNHFVQKEPQLSSCEVLQQQLQTSMENKINSENSVNPRCHDVAFKRTNFPQIVLSSPKYIGNYNRLSKMEEMKKPLPADPFKSFEDYERMHPANYSYPPKTKERTNDAVPGSYTEPPKDARNPFEYGPEASFSLKYKEQQLRQEGTIITIKPEPVQNNNNNQMYDAVRLHPRAIIKTSKPSLANIYHHQDKNHPLFRGTSMYPFSAESPNFDLIKIPVSLTGKESEPHPFQQNDTYRVEVGNSEFPDYDVDQQQVKHLSMPVVPNKPGQDLVSHHHQSMEIIAVPQSLISSANKNLISGQMQPPQNWRPNQSRTMSSPHGASTTEPHSIPAQNLFLPPMAKSSESPTNVNQMVDRNQTPYRNSTISSPNQLSQQSTPSPASYIRVFPHQLMPQRSPSQQIKYSTSFDPLQLDIAKLKRTTDYDDQQKYTKQKYAEQMYAEQSYAEQKYSGQKYADQKRYYDQHNSSQNLATIKYSFDQKYASNTVISSAMAQYVDKKHFQKPAEPELPQNIHSIEEINFLQGTQYASSSTMTEKGSHLQSPHCKILDEMYSIKSSDSEFQLNHYDSSATHYGNVEAKKSETDLKQLHTEQDPHTKLAVNVKYANQTNIVQYKREKIHKPVDKQYRYSTERTDAQKKKSYSVQTKYDDCRYSPRASILISAPSHRSDSSHGNTMDNYHPDKYSSLQNTDQTQLQTSIPKPFERVQAPKTVSNPPSEKINCPVELATSHNIALKKDSQQSLHSQTTTNLKFEENRITKIGVKTISPTLRPVKRESPLDLSVKTVKTKADSTGCDDSGSVNSPHIIRSYNPHVPKVEFSRRIQHGAVPQVYNYDSRMAENVAGSSRTPGNKIVRSVIMSQIQPGKFQRGSNSSDSRSFGNQLERSGLAHNQIAYDKRVQSYTINMPQTINHLDQIKSVDASIYNTISFKKEEYDLGAPYRTEYNQHAANKLQHSNYANQNSINNFTELPNNQCHIIEQQQQQLSQVNMQIGSTSFQHKYHMTDKLCINHNPYPNHTLPQSNATYYPNNYNQQKTYAHLDNKDKNLSAMISKEKSVNNTPYATPKALEDHQRLEDRKYVESILYSKKGIIYPSNMMMRSQYEKTYTQSTAKSSQIFPPRKRPPSGLQHIDDLHQPKQYKFEHKNRDSYGQYNLVCDANSIAGAQLPKKDHQVHCDYYGHLHDKNNQKMYHQIPETTESKHLLQQHTSGSNSDPCNYKRFSVADTEHHYYEMKNSEQQQQMQTTDENIEVDRVMLNFFSPRPRIEEGSNYSNNKNDNSYQNNASYSHHPSQPSQLPRGFVNQEVNNNPNMYSTTNWYPAALQAVDPNKRYLLEGASNHNYILRPIDYAYTNLESYKTQNCHQQKATKPETYQQSEESNIQPRPTTINNNMSRGADQNVISKLRNSLELKEIEKLKLKMRKQSNAEISGDDTNKADMASILAARIRTKGELKGFTPITAYEEQVKQSELEKSPDVPKESLVPPVVLDGPAAFDLLDWGTACNEFVEQLQTGKKRGRRKRGVRKRSEAEIRIDENEEKNRLFTLLPGNDSHMISDVPKEVVISLNQKEKSSSDEDKPLLFLRQQTVIQSAIKAFRDDLLKNRSESNIDDSTKDSSATMQSISRSIVVERLSEKVARNMREKQRLEKEQQIAARLGISSSSDSEPEPRVQRTKKRARKLRPRSLLGMKSSSDNNTADDTKDFKSRLGEKLSSGSATDENQKSQKKKKKNLLTLDGSSTSDKRQNKSKDQNAERADKPKKYIYEKSQPRSNSDRKLSTKNASKSKASSEDQKSDESANEKINKSSDKTSNFLSKIFTNGATKNVGRGRSKSQLDVNVKQLVDIKTMTRSKTKLVLEKKMSDSKVLRNEKVVHNTIVERKAKPHETSSKTPTKPTTCSYTKKKCTPEHTDSSGKRQISDSEYDNSESGKRKKNLRRMSELLSSSESEGSSHKETSTPVIERLRSRQSKTKAQVAELKMQSKKHPEKKISDRSSARKGLISKKIVAIEPKITKFVPGWEEQVIEFKRKLKIPDSLITVARPTYHCRSTSLPDLDPHSSDTTETFSIFKSRQRNGNPEKISFKNDQPFKRNLFKKFNSKSDVICQIGVKKELPNTEKSIIDVLHQRVLNPVNKNRKFRQNHMFSEPKVIPKGNENELLSTPGIGNDEIFSIKNTHFKTSVMISRTRTEQKVQKTKELIRKVFGGEDRPASAPPIVLVPSSGIDATSTPLTFSQHYEEMLRKMNIDFGEKIRKNKNKSPSNVFSVTKVIIKSENFYNMEVADDDETQDTIVNEMQYNDGDTPSVASERDLLTPISFKSIITTNKTRKSRGCRAGKRKGSSGFDYIRKKKKTPVLSTNINGSNHVIPKRRAAAVNFLQEKDENDISREIKGWVPNKSIGESVMHKASRLGYIDVIAFCLDRLEMHPDQKDNAGYTPLHEACSRGHLEISRMLLQFGANHSETAQSGIRPLHEAVENGHTEIVRLMLSYGADPLLATYSGTTPIALAETQEMTEFLHNYLDDVQSMSEKRHICWMLSNLWKVYDPDNEGYDALGSAPEFCEDILADASQKELIPIKNQCDSDFNIMTFESQINNLPATKKIIVASLQPLIMLPSEVKIEQNIMYDKNIKYKNCTVVLNKIDSDPRLSNNRSVVRVVEEKSISIPIAKKIDKNSGIETFELEESKTPLPPIYLLKDEGQDKWVLLSDLCSLLKVKSKDAVLKQIYPSSPPSSVNKELFRELKMSDFLEKAVCLQLLCAGEKLNIRSSKVILVRYNESVQNLLGVQTIVMKI